MYLMGTKYYKPRIELNPRERIMVGRFTDSPSRHLYTVYVTM